MLIRNNPKEEYLCEIFVNEYTTLLSGIGLVVYI